MINFADEPIPPRLTPSPNQRTDEDHCLNGTLFSEEIYTRNCLYYASNTAADQSGGRGGWRVKICPYNLQWPLQFQTISSNLQRIFRDATPPAQYTSIEHIGSTSVPGLHAKSNIDILVTFPDPTALANGIDALLWEIPSHPPFVRYSRVANGGGIQGRESFKLYLPTHSPYYTSTPEQSVYLIDESDGNPHGQLQVRSYRSLRDTLLNPVNKDLLREYAEIKLKLAEETFESTMIYSVKKDVIIRKILGRAGWTDEEIDEKERLSVREDIDYEEEPPY